MLIKEMSMQSGYSSSALHERIYSSENMRGILIYTGAADKEGSLQLLIIVLKLTKKMEPLFLLSIYQESRILILKDYIEICKLDSIFIQINLLYI